MQQNLILFPLISLVLFTGCLGFALLFQRVRAVRQGSLSPSYFKYNRGGKPPEPLLKTGQHFENLLETPPLFYLGCLLIFVLHQTDSGYLALAWLYVASRLLHAWIHLGTNNIRHRAIAFSGGFLIMLAIWLRLLFQLI